ncbi:MAG: hypothetical protein WCA81_00080 [Rhizomicrobium sp.]
MTRLEIDPFALLAMPDLADEELFDAIDDALRRFDPDNAAPLIALLESEDEYARGRGLHVFCQLGRKGFVALDSALKSIGDPSVYARSHLMDGALCGRELRPDQACQILPLVTDKAEIVRGKVITFIACAQLETLETAIALIDEPQRRDHIEGFQCLLKRPENIQALFDAAILNADVQSSYALASIKRLAREGAITSPPVYDGDGYVPRGVIHFVNMWITRRMRRRSTGLE